MLGDSRRKDTQVFQASQKKKQDDPSLFYTVQSTTFAKK